MHDSSMGETLIVQIGPCKTFRFDRTNVGVGSVLKVWSKGFAGSMNTQHRLESWMQTIQAVREDRRGRVFHF